MKALALVELLVADTDLIAYQRRDEYAPTSPNLLGLFGGHIDPEDQDPITAAYRELREETTINVASLAIHHVVSLTIPEDYHAPNEAITAHLFRTTINDLGFHVYEGRGHEEFSRDEAIARSDLAPTVRYIYEQQKTN